jgi:hypothetical protein
MSAASKVPVVEARFILESLLQDISGLAKVLLALGVRATEEDSCYAFLGGQLHDYAEEARDAYCRIYGLNEYAASRGGPGPEAR